MAVIGEDGVVRSQFNMAIPDLDVYTFLEAKLREHDPQLVALINVETDRSLTYGELLTQSTKMATHLHARGFRLGDVIGICCHNCYELFVVILAAFKLGGCVAPINRLYTKGEITKAVQMTKPRFIFTNDNLAGIFQDIRQHSSIKDILTLGQHPGCLSWTHMMADSPRREVPLVITRDVIDPVRQTAFIMSSSGTTGLPKAVEITHRNVVAQIVHRGQPMIDYIGLRRILYQPLSHMYGLMVSTVGLACGATTWLMAAFDLEMFLRIISENKVNVLHLVPPVVIQMVKSPLTSRYYLTHVTDCISAAAALSPNVEEQLRRHLGPMVKIRQGYGLTETCAPASNTQHNDGGPRASIGLPIPNTMMKVVHLNTGESLPADQTGEICVKGPQVMKGYLGNPNATREAIDQDGWLHTGDIGYYDRDGYFFLVDRLKELIKYQGYQVAPAELEDLLLHHPAVADAGVIGVPDEEKGELPMAWIVRKPDLEHSGVTERDIMDYIAERVAPFKKLRRVRFVSSIPKSASGKILRRRMRKAMADADTDRRSKL